MLNKLKMVENELSNLAKEEKDDYRKHWILGLRNTVSGIVDDIYIKSVVVQEEPSAQELIDEVLDEKH